MLLRIATQGPNVGHGLLGMRKMMPVTSKGRRRGWCVTVSDVPVGNMWPQCRVAVQCAVVRWRLWWCVHRTWASVLAIGSHTTYGATAAGG